MTEQPITQAQLDALEKVADRLFAKLGIDIEFTRHFVDRVNDERNRTQITIRELGQIFAKEYQRWGRTISKMPINTQAVMKDLSSALNIPFVLNKDGEGKELVAKTVMRKPDFKTTNKTLPVESIQEDDAGSTRVEVPGIGVYTVATLQKNLAGKFDELAEMARSGDPSAFRRIAHALENSALTPMSKALVGAYDQLAKQSKHSKAYGESVETGSQVRGSEPTPKKQKAGKGHQSPHPMRGRLVGEEMDQALDVPTPDITTIAKKHGVGDSMIAQQLKKGIEIELEHTTNRAMAKEIALDHLNEMPDYYTKLDKMEVSEMLVKGAWEVQQLREGITDPKQAILNKALEYLDRMVKQDTGDKQSIGSYAFEIARMFNLKDIVNPRQLETMYRKKHDLKKDSGDYSY
jgi:hypothetical protein